MSTPPTLLMGYGTLYSYSDTTHSLDAFEMKELRKILRVSWTAKKTNEWVLNKAGVKRELLDTVKARKLAYSIRKQGCCLDSGERDNARNNVSSDKMGLYAHSGGSSCYVHTTRN